MLAEVRASSGEAAASVPLGMVVWGLAGVLIANLVAAVILRAGAEWAEHKDIEYADAYATMLLCGLTSLVLVVVLGPAVNWAPLVDSDSSLEGRMSVRVSTRFLDKRGHYWCTT